SICPVRRSPFGWSVAICALLISLPHLSQSTLLRWTTLACAPSLLHSSSFSLGTINPVMEMWCIMLLCYYLIVILLLCFLYVIVMLLLFLLFIFLHT
ncbi:hypothetical protein L9F63_019827, partial [Diploptera punctata]